MIDRQEFRDAVSDIRADIGGVNARLDTLNGRTRKNEQDIAVLHDRGVRAGVAFGGGVALLVSAVVEVLRWTLGKH